MVISIALFGITASGIVLNLARDRLGRPGALPREIATSVLLFSICSVVSFLVVNGLPLDYFKLSTDLWQLLYLAVTFLLFSLPFFFSGLVSALAYSYQSERSGRIYFASMTGSAGGALLPITLIPLLGLRGAILLAALLPAAVLIPLYVYQRRVWILPLCVTGVIGLLIFFPRLGAITPSPYKLLSQYRQYPGTHVVDTAQTIKGQFDRVKSPYIRFAPGLSLKYRGSMPGQQAIIRDGDAQLVLYDLKSSGSHEAQQGSLEAQQGSHEAQQGSHEAQQGSHEAQQGSRPIESESFAAYTLSFVGYRLAPKADSALIIQRGGGLAVVCALTAEIDSVRLIEELPYLARAARSHYSASGDKLEVIQESPRLYLARSDERFDFIHIENWGSSLPGMESLFQEHLFTKEAFVEYLSHLTDRGIIVLSRRLLIPPADSLRLLAAVKGALASKGISDPARHLALARNWDSFLIVVSNSPLSSEQIDEFRRYTGERNFDLIFYPGISTGELNRFHILDHPYYYESTVAVLKDPQARYLEDYALNVDAQSDDRPFHNQYLRWSKIGELLKNVGSRMYALVLSGEMIVVIVFAVALLVSFLLLYLPVALTAGRAPPMILYFLALGAGFMFVEMAFIKELTFLLGDPVLALSFVLAAILLFSGAGGFVSDRLKAKNLKWILALLAATVLVLAILIYHLVQSIMPVSLWIRVIVSLLVILPASFLMGFPFPTAIRLLVPDSAHRAYGWAANGSTSVLTSIVAVQIAMVSGISKLFLAGGLAYVLALVVLFWQSQRCCRQSRRS